MTGTMQAEAALVSAPKNAVKMVVLTAVGTVAASVSLLNVATVTRTPVAVPTTTMVAAATVVDNVAASAIAAADVAPVTVAGDVVTVAYEVTVATIAMTTTATSTTTRTSGATKHAATTTARRPIVSGTTIATRGTCVMHVWSSAITRTMSTVPALAAASTVVAPAANTNTVAATVPAVNANTPTRAMRAQYSTMLLSKQNPIRVHSAGLLEEKNFT